MGIDNIDELKPGYEEPSRIIKKIERPLLELRVEEEQNILKPGPYDYLGPQGNPPWSSRDHNWAGRGYTKPDFDIELIHDDPAVD